MPATEELYRSVVTEGSRRRRRYRIAAGGTGMAALIAVIALVAIRLASEPGDVVTSNATAPVCRNSSAPACGPFRWDPAPADDQPVTATVTFAPEHPRVGETVTFTVHAEDPDADVSCVALTFPQGVTAGEFCSTPAIGCLVEPHGPWDPPAAVPSSVDRVFTHVFDTSGAVTIPVDVWSVGGSRPQAPGQAPLGCPDALLDDPYGSTTRVSITVEVAA